MKASRTLIALSSAALLGTTMLAACGSSSEAESSASPSASVESVAPTPTPEPSESLVGGDPSTWAPIEVTQAMNGEKVKIVVGQAVIFTDLPKNDADNKVVLLERKEGVVTVVQQGPNRNAGFSGLAPGRTRVTVWDGKPKAKGSEVIMYVIIRVNEAPAATG